MTMCRTRASLLAAFTALLLASTTLAASPPAADVPAGSVATVNGQPISKAEFHAAYADLARKRFWHGGIATEKAEALRREVLDRLVLYHLVVAEAARRGIDGDAPAVDEKIDELRGRMLNDEARKTLERNIPQLRQEMLESSRIDALEAQVRTVATPSESTLRQFHKKRIDAFTEPASERVSLILVGVSPSGLNDEWQVAEAKAKEIERELRAGADFATIARERSSDQSAAEGGDMGYLHRGMLAEPAQQAIDKLHPGEISAPVRLLQGVALFRVTDRKSPQAHSLAEVRERALELYKRDTADEQWRRFTETLKARAIVKLGEMPDVATLAPSK